MQSVDTLYSKPSLIRIDAGVQIIRINEAKAAQGPKKLGTQINWKFNDINIADENEFRKSLYGLVLKKYRKPVHLYIDIRLRSCTSFGRIMIQI
jgi:hypothetical protein